MSPFQLIIFATIAVLVLTARDSIKKKWKQKLIAIAILSVLLMLTERFLL
ncbi:MULTISPECIES: hypothetical protein [Oceanobacillus]|uniref:Uncharacterized protein n=1 Tax=Oceanobacillus kimchii TaxID=746691 RepID=A0ABQ5TKJ1_9BACI|nr:MULTISPECIES: hypothetical protein [Oceanobacillus]MBT2598611.1 hypothetical protein [Oceanobacillus sp. ISL-74]MBT2651530.1 hypothetical protein [Oceanobacillus sp. ISL-73]GLO66094.1 hypothetical protein MACH08_18780 [Oceanobacillus kimchii]